MPFARPLPPALPAEDSPHTLRVPALPVAVAPSLSVGGNGSLHLWKYKYPGKRATEPKDGKEPEGVPGQVQELNRVSLATQPISSFQWSQDKLGASHTVAVPCCCFHGPDGVLPRTRTRIVPTLVVGVAHNLGLLRRGGRACCTSWELALGHEAHAQRPRAPRRRKRCTIGVRTDALAAHVDVPFACAS